MSGEAGGDISSSPSSTQDAHHHDVPVMGDASRADQHHVKDEEAPAATMVQQHVDPFRRVPAAAIRPTVQPTTTTGGAPGAAAEVTNRAQSTSPVPKLNQQHSPSAATGAPGAKLGKAVPSHSDTTQPSNFHKAGAIIRATNKDGTHMFKAPSELVQITAGSSEFMRMRKKSVLSTKRPTFLVCEEHSQAVRAILSGLGKGRAPERVTRPLGNSKADRAILLQRLVTHETIDLAQINSASGNPFPIAVPPQSTIDKFAMTPESSRTRHHFGNFSSASPQDHTGATSSVVEDSEFIPAGASGFDGVHSGSSAGAGSAGGWGGGQQWQPMESPSLLFGLGTSLGALKKEEVKDDTTQPELHDDSEPEEHDEISKKDVNNNKITTQSDEHTDGAAAEVGPTVTLTEDEARIGVDTKEKEKEKDESEKQVDAIPVDQPAHMNGAIPRESTWTTTTTTTTVTVATSTKSAIKPAPATDTQPQQSAASGAQNPLLFELDILNQQEVYSMLSNTGCQRGRECPYIHLPPNTTHWTMHKLTADPHAYLRYDSDDIMVPVLCVEKSESASDATPIIATDNDRTILASVVSPGNTVMTTTTTASTHTAGTTRTRRVLAHLKVSELFVTKRLREFLKSVKQKKKESLRALGRDSASASAKSSGSDVLRCITRSHNEEDESKSTDGKQSNDPTHGNDTKVQQTKGEGDVAVLSGDHPLMDDEDGFVAVHDDDDERDGGAEGDKEKEKGRQTGSTSSVTFSIRLPDSSNVDTSPKSSIISQPGNNQENSGRASPSSKPQPPQEDEWLVECENFANGLCTYGTSCRFVHPVGGGLAAPEKEFVIVEVPEQQQQPQQQQQQQHPGNQKGRKVDGAENTQQRQGGQRAGTGANKGPGPGGKRNDRTQPAVLPMPLQHGMSPGHMLGQGVVVGQGIMPGAMVGGNMAGVSMQQVGAPITYVQQQQPTILGAGQQPRVQSSGGYVQVGGGMQQQQVFQQQQQQRPVTYVTNTVGQQQPGFQQMTAGFPAGQVLAPQQQQQGYFQGAVPMQQQQQQPQQQQFIIQQQTPSFYGAQQQGGNVILVQQPQMGQQQMGQTYVIQQQQPQQQQQQQQMPMYPAQPGLGGGFVYRQ